MSHWLLEDSRRFLDGLAPTVQLEFLTKRLDGRDTAPISQGYADASSEEPEDVVAAALSQEMESRFPELHAQAVAAVENSFKEVLTAVVSNSLTDHFASVGTRVLQAMAAAQHSAQRNRVFALVDLLEPNMDANSQTLFKASIRALFGLPKERRDLPFWSRLCGHAFADGFAREAVRELAPKYDRAGGLNAVRTFAVRTNLEFSPDNVRSDADAFFRQTKSVPNFYPKGEYNRNPLNKVFPSSATNNGAQNIYGNYSGDLGRLDHESLQQTGYA